MDRSGRKSHFPASADGSGAELRVADAVWRVHVREHLLVCEIGVMSHYLSILLFLPLAGALALLLVPKTNENAIRWIANVTALVGFVISVPLWFWYNPQNPDFQFV